MNKCFGVQLEDSITLDLYCQAQPKLQVKLSLKAELALFSFDPAHSLRNQTHSLRNQPRESTHSLRNQPCESLFSFLIAPNLNPTVKFK